VSVPVIPDYVSPIVGHRIWLWNAEKGVTSLNGETWLPGRAFAAECMSNYNHGCPADGCSCGVYAAKNDEHLQKSGLQRLDSFLALHGKSSVLQGEVCLRGRVVEHELGYRAQFAYPKSFVLSPNIDGEPGPSCLESLVVYGVDIVTSTNTLLWDRGSGYTRAGLDWLAEKRQPWHQRTDRVGDRVTVLGKGIGVVESEVKSSGGTVIYIRLSNNDLCVVQLEDLVPNAQESRREVDSSKYRDAIIAPSSKGWEIYCRRYPRPLPNLASVRISAAPKDQEAIDELRKLEFRLRELEPQLEDRETIHATARLNETFTPLCSWLVILVILVLWHLIFYGVSSIAKFR
jgi:hypothetical protein